MSRRLSPYEHVQRDVKEKQLRMDIEEAAQRLGWMCMFIQDSRQSAGAGWPDMTLAKVQSDGTARLLCLELKRETENPTPAQVAWLAVLSLVPGITARVARPSDWDWVLGEMQR